MSTTEEENPNEGGAPEDAFTDEERMTYVVQVPGMASTDGVVGPHDMQQRRERRETLEREIWELVMRLAPARALELAPSFRRISEGEAVEITIRVFGPFQIPSCRWTKDDEELLARVREYVEGRKDLNHFLERERERRDLELIELGNEVGAVSNIEHQRIRNRILIRNRCLACGVMTDTEILSNCKHGRGYCARSECLDRRDGAVILAIQVHNFCNPRGTCNGEPVRISQDPDKPCSEDGDRFAISDDD